MCSIAREIKEERKSIVNCRIKSRESFQLFYIRYGMENTIRENFCNEKKRNKNSKLLNGMISIIRKVIKNPEMIPDDISKRISSKII